MKRVTMLFTALTILMGASAIQPQPVEAAKMFDGWKSNRPFGPALHFFPEMDIIGSRQALEVEKAIKNGEFDGLNTSTPRKYNGGEPFWYRQNLYFCPVAGTNVISAAIPCDVPLRIWYIAMGHSGEHAKPKDKVNLSLWYMDHKSNGWIRLAHQSSDDQGDLPVEQRWAGALTCYITPEWLRERGVRTCFFKADTDNSIPLPIIQISVTTWRLRDYFLLQAGELGELSLLPAWDEESQAAVKPTNPATQNSGAPTPPGEVSKDSSSQGASVIEFIAPPTAPQVVLPAKVPEPVKEKKGDAKPKNGQQTKK